MIKITIVSTFIFLIWLLARIFFMDQFYVASSSMEPTIVPGDRVFVNKTILGARIYTSFNFNKNDSALKCIRMRGLRALKHNDIIVFNYPFHKDKILFVLNHVYVKRCIGLPGDSIGIVNGIYTNNNTASVGLRSTQLELSKMKESEIDSTILKKKNSDSHYLWTIKNMPPLYIPRKNDIISITPKEGYLYKRVLEWETGKKIKVDWGKSIVYADNRTLKKHTFEHNYLFVVGDNATDSQDSRYWGIIPENYVIGVVGYILH